MWLVLPAISEPEDTEAGLSAQMETLWSAEVFGRAAQLVRPLLRVISGCFQDPAAA